MSGQRSDNGRNTSGPLDRDELESLFERGYGLSSHRFIAEAWGLEADAEPETIVERYGSTDRIERRLDQMKRVDRAILGQVVASGGRIRGENLRRDLLLSGFGDTEANLEELVSSCVLIPVPNPGESELDIEELLEGNNFLQHDLAVSPRLQSELEEESQDLDTDAIRAWEGDISRRRRENLDALELNLLHLASLLEREPLRLNKSGAPNRRSLRRFARGIAFPGDPGEIGDDLDLNDPLQLDYLTFLLAMAFELDFVERDEDEQLVNGNSDPVRDFFRSEPGDRNSQLINAFQGLKHWNEVESLGLVRGERHPDYEEHFSQSEKTGEPFIGARGYVLSVLRRSQLWRWTSREAIVELCTQLDREYLPRTLSKADVDVEPTEYIEAVLDRGLKWLGALEVGESDDGVEVLRFRDRGADVVGLKEKGDVEEDAGPEKDDEGCLVVQPNYEVMLFLEKAPLEILFYLYHTGERDKLADRVANFRLTAESVQWGYSHGLDADTILDILEDYSHAPVPDTVEFQLKDWERVHRQLKLYADGVLLRHSDPERLDLLLGQLEHDWRGEDIESIRLGPSSVFIGESNPPGLARIVEQEDALDIDYLGEIPPCLYFVDSLEIMVHPLECDLVTMTELQKIGEKLEGSTEESQFYELQIDAIAERWPENTLEEAIDFLDVRTEGGIPPAQALRLKSLLEEPLQASVAQNRVVVELESAIVADHFERVPECETIIDRRLGDRWFAVRADHLEELQDVFDELGVEATIDDG